MIEWLMDNILIAFALLRYLMSIVLIRNIRSW